VITPTHYMALSAALFIIGVVGVLMRRNIIIIFMSIELILNAVNINLVAFSYKLQNGIGQVFAIFVIAVAGALGLSLYAFWQMLGLPSESREHVVTIASWIPPIPAATAHGIGAFQVPWAFRLDPLAGMMILIVTGIGFLIHVYATSYMMDEPRGAYARFFCY